ncbi:MAG: hypothetical protein ABI551_19195 [Polyangiaceae bacterium]
MRLRWLFLAALSTAIAGCAGSEKSFDGHIFRDGRIAFRTGDVPPGWKRIDVTNASLAFRDETHGASVLLNARCGMRDDDVPLTALTAHLIMGTTERSYSKEETIPFDGREARHTLLQAKLDGVLLAYDIYVEKKDGCVYDFVYISSPGEKAGGVEFERFVGDFRTLGTNDVAKSEP